MASNNAQRLSRILWDAREYIDMTIQTIERASGTIDYNSRRLRDEIDAYRSEKGWSPNGFGGEVMPGEEDALCVTSSFTSFDV